MKGADHRFEPRPPGGVDEVAGPLVEGDDVIVLVDDVDRDLPGVARLLGDEMARETAGNMEYDWRPDAAGMLFRAE